VADSGAVRVYLADSSPDLQTILRGALPLDGAELIGSAGNGTQALRQLRALCPDILITELLLPEIDGITLLRILHREQLMPKTIVLSAFCSEYAARAAGQLGVEYFLPKPCGMDVLRRCVRELSCVEADGAVSLSCAVRAALLRFPIPAHLNGYPYLRDALLRVVEDRGSLQGVTKALYRDIARTHRTTAECVERSMRAAIARGWDLGARSGRAREFGSAFEAFARPPTVTQFLGIMAEQISLEQANRPR
jgi:two-component system response regulator (stage 0 sporulation protein A)